MCYCARRRQTHAVIGPSETQKKNENERSANMRERQGGEAAKETRASVSAIALADKDICSSAQIRASERNADVVDREDRRERIASALSDAD